MDNTSDLFAASTLAEGLIAKSSGTPYEPTLRIVRRELFEKASKEAVACPCCSRLVRIYRRKFNRGMALALVYIYKEHLAQYSGPKVAREMNEEDRNWIHVDRLLVLKKAPTGVRGDYHKLRHFGLLEHALEKRADGSNRNGYWRITQNGVLFVEDALKVATFAIFYNQELLALDGANIGIREALGKKFNYEELMK